MKKSKYEIKMICDNCSKEQQPDVEKSNDNWKIYHVIKCECGGNFKPNFNTKICKY